MARWYHRWRVSRARIDQNAKCPGCGYRHGQLKFSSTRKVMLHKCFVCDAIWAEPTVLAVEFWIES